MVSDFELALLRRMMNEWGENFWSNRSCSGHWILSVALAGRPFGGSLSSNFRQPPDPLVEMGFVQLSAERNGMPAYLSVQFVYVASNALLFTFFSGGVSMPKVNAYCAQCAIDSLQNVYWCIRMECVWICCVDIICVEYLHTCLSGVPF